MITLPKEQIGKIPPRIVSYASHLPTADAREYVQDLIGKYEYKARHLTVTAAGMFESWTEAQRAHLEIVIDQLYWMRDNI